MIQPWRKWKCYVLQLPLLQHQVEGWGDNEDNALTVELPASQLKKLRIDQKLLAIFQNPSMQRNQYVLSVDTNFNFYFFFYLSSFVNYY